MALADQSQQWYPTSVQVTVFQARNLRIKGKNGTNDAYAIIQVGKDKFSTSVAEKCVAPVWKEEATFDLPLFHQSNAEKCTLYIIVMHRALVGLDKLLGQAVINLVDLHDKKSRSKTEWFKLLDKNGKADKDRGEVLLDIQFMRNNMTASMFDLSMQDKPRSRIGKLKDKIRGKKKDGFSDSASAIVPSVTQVLTDSEGEGDAHVDSPGVKKKSKLKTLFAPKSNLQRNISQSMSTLGSLPEKNSALSGSRSSGLNMDSPEVKKKFKFKAHKRTASSDSKVSLGPFSLLGRSKQNIAEQNNLCINGSHVYTEEPEPRMSKAGSTLSLNSSGQGSVEDLRRAQGRNNSDVSADSLKGLSLPSYRAESRERDLLEQRRLEQEEEERRQAEESRRAEAKRMQEELARLEEQERRRQEEARQAEEERRLQEETKKKEALKRQEEARKAEEHKHQEEASVSDRLSSLFGIIRKKEEKKDELVEQPASAPQEEKTKPAPRSLFKDPSEAPLPVFSTNPFEEISLSPEPLNPFESHTEPQREVRSPQTPSTGFPSRTAKVSAQVKPRLVVSGKAEPNKSESPSPPVNADSLTEPSPPSSSSTDSSVSSLPLETPVMFSELHTSLAPPKSRWSSTESLGSSTENLAAVGPSSSATGKKRQAPLPPSYQDATRKVEQLPTVPMHTESHNSVSRQSKPTPRSLSAKTAATSGYLHPIAELNSTGNGETPSSQQSKLPTLPLPDYDTLYPKRKHGVQGQMKWDHIVAEVTQRQRDYPPELIGIEVSVDRPGPVSQDRQGPTHKDRSDFSDMKTSGSVQAMGSHKEPSNALKQMGSSSKHAIAPAKPMAVAPGGPVGSTNMKQDQSTKQAPPVVNKPNAFASRVFGAATPKVQNSSAPSVKPRAFVEDERKILNTSVNISGGKPLPSDERPKTSEKVGNNFISAGVIQEKPDNRTKEAPPVSLRQKPVGKELGSVTQMKSSTTVEEFANEDIHTSNNLVQAINKESGVVTQLENCGHALTEKSANEGKDSSAFMTKAPENEDFDETLRMKDSSTFMAEDVDKAANEESHLSVGTLMEANRMPKQDIFVEKAEDLFPIDEKSETDPFPNDAFFHKDPWALPVQNFERDDLFTGGSKRAQKPEDLGMTTDDIEKLFAPQVERDPFSDYDHSDIREFSEMGKPVEYSSSKQSPAFQRTSSKKSRAPLPPVKADKVEVKKGNEALQVQPRKDKDTEVNIFGAKEQQSESEIRNLRSLDEEKAPAQGREGQWAVDPFSSPSPTMHSSLTSSEPLKTTLGDDTPQLGGVPGGKTPLRAWVSPSEAQPITVQSSSGGGAVGKGGEPASTPRRPHPVKPMSSLESQPPTSISFGRDIKSAVIHENMPGKSKVTSSVETGPYSQLTQDELISLVVKQQAELSKRDGKILELEEYIDNLLVRVIEEKPSILLSLGTTKKAC